MPRDVIDQRMSAPNALASQYQRDYIGSDGQLNVSYVTHETGSKGMGRIFGAGFTEQLPSLVRAERGSGN